MLADTTPLLESGSFSLANQPAHLARARLTGAELTNVNLRVTNVQRPCSEGRIRGALDLSFSPEYSVARQTPNELGVSLPDLRCNRLQMNR